MPLHHAPAGDPRVLDNAPVAVLLAILPANLVQRKNMMAAIVHTLAALKIALVGTTAHFRPILRVAHKHYQSLARSRGRQNRRRGRESANFG